MFLPPAGPLSLIDTECCLHVPHLIFSQVFGKFHPHFEGSDFILTEGVHLDWSGDESVLANVGGFINGEFEYCVIGFPGGVEDMESVQ